jgi:hypothetical protein
LGVQHPLGEIPTGPLIEEGLLELEDRIERSRDLQEESLRVMTKLQTPLARQGTRAPDRGDLLEARPDGLFRVELNRDARASGVGSPEAFLGVKGKVG